MSDKLLLRGGHLLTMDPALGDLASGEVLIEGGTIAAVARLIDPIAAVTRCADVSNVRTVVIGGRVRKRDGRLVADHEAAGRLVEQSRDYLVAERARRQAAASAG